jgi:nucleoside-triphosphatase THEP1
VKDEEKIFDLATRFVHFTNEHLFITGKAGTGKTTFLRSIKENCTKKMAIVAPTGVAAINAGGVTIHSFFQLPPGGYIPDSDQFGETESGKFISHRGLLKNIRFSAAKREILQELELLIIDEVSMLRSDMLDAMNIILQSIRHNKREPFGGVQVLYIGDLYQLPPVVGNDEWDVLQAYYKSPFFFDAIVLENAPPVYLELTKIYRQSDAGFIDVLNSIRNNEISEDDINYLNRRYDPYFIPDENDSVVVLTTHNYKADKMNLGALNQLQTQDFIFKGEIKNEFNEKVLPVDMELRLKKGAQVMFIRNDKGEDRQYYNGKIGTIQDIGEDYIRVMCKGDDDPIDLKKETWDNIKYVYNPDKDSLEEEVMGSYSQYPLRLAWAITIHKSQGLTFEKAVIDAVDSFSPGQVYVALSRLTGLDGLILSSPIHEKAIQTDERILKYKDHIVQLDSLNDLLAAKQDVFIQQMVIRSFQWDKLIRKLDEFVTQKKLLLIEDSNDVSSRIANIKNSTYQLKSVGDKFVGQLQRLFALKNDDDFTEINDRLLSASHYFKTEIEKVLSGIDDTIAILNTKKKVKKKIVDLKIVKTFFVNHLDYILRSQKIVQSIIDKTDMLDALKTEKKVQEHVPSVKELKEEVKKEKQEKREKGITNKISFDLYKEGKTIEEIAIERGMAITTIEGHLSHFIATGELDVRKFISDKKLQEILKVIVEVGGEQLTPIKQLLGDDYSFGEIRMALAHHKMKLTIS